MTRTEIFEIIFKMPSKKRLAIYDDMLSLYNKNGLKALSDEQVKEYYEKYLMGDKK